ncbi:hypothetical protein KDC22_14525 [Paenibacillus tritici]|uniref:hypothetical protein n=1 Tax=Paenibacillus tritici TaxID=1873425 RepID=UPI001BABDC4A|nr:hypothetical protein [Paenibacillus tritici]QUL57582.1 hypothetical protein KDC22_14525 [Paenibacillus tritici]
MGYFIVSAVVITLISWAYLNTKSNQNEELANTREENKRSYHDSLGQLSSDSNNVQLRVDALEKGRKYYASLRPDGIATITDEASITNDLNAHSGNSNKIND